MDHEPFNSASMPKPQQLGYFNTKFFQNISSVLQNLSKWLKQCFSLNLNIIKLQIVAAIIKENRKIA